MPTFQIESLRSLTISFCDGVCSQRTFQYIGEYFRKLEKLVNIGNILEFLGIYRNIFQRKQRNNSKYL